MTGSTSSLDPTKAALVTAIRAASGVLPNEGPSDVYIANALDGFVDQFDYWFDRVIAEAVPQYRKLIIGRINPFVRGIEYQGFTSDRAAKELVRDYANRNFVTAGGWAIEKMAIALGSKNAKAAASGIDLHKIDPVTGVQNLYVIKSGAVTRNSDILSALKRNAEQARKLLMQGGSKVAVFAHYAVAAGATTSTYADNIHRPSSAAFWADVTELDEDKAIRLAHEISKTASAIVKRETESHMKALELLVDRYIQRPGGTGAIDWDFLFERNMRPPNVWKTEDANRHGAAWTALMATGYQPRLATKKAKPRAKLKGKPKAPK